MRVKELIVIYFTGLIAVSAWPSKVSLSSFVNISSGLHFKIDDQSPVVAAEKDLLALEKSENQNKQNQLWTNLNQTTRPKPKAVLAKVVDYSRNLQDIENRLAVSIRGPIQLKQGLALTAEHRIEIHQEINGKIIESGDVDIDSGTYTIRVGDLAGKLCAKLKGERSELMGRGCISLDNLRTEKRSLATGPLLSVFKYQDLIALTESESQKISERTMLPEIESIEMKPSLAHKVYDFYGYNSDQPRVIENAKIENAVTGQESNSSYIVTSISAPGFMPTRIVGGAKTSRRGAPLLAMNAAKAMNEIARDAGYTDGDMNSRGTMWGRVMSEGQTVAGAEVSIDGDPGARPLYFNELYIPDPNQKVTASHGLYAFMNLTDGEYAVRADINNKFAGFQNVSVRTGAIALADIESTNLKREVKISTFDIINKSIQPSVATLQNYHEDVVLEEGQVELGMPLAADDYFAIIHPLNREYLTAQYRLSANEKNHQLPLIHREWMEKLLSQANLNRAIQSKIILGFGPQEPFRAFALGSSQARVIYFDSNAQVVAGNFGPAGGGFLILDPEQSVIEFAIQKSTTKQLDVNYMPTAPGVLSVIRVK